MYFEETSVIIFNLIYINIVYAYIICVWNEDKKEINK